MEHGNSDFRSEFLEIPGKYGNLLNSYEKWEICEKDGNRDFLGNWTPESLIFLVVYWCFRDGRSFHKNVIFAEKVQNHKKLHFKILL